MRRRMLTYGSTGVIGVAKDGVPVYADACMRRRMLTYASTGVIGVAKDGVPVYAPPAAGDAGFVREQAEADACGEHLAAFDVC